MIGLINYGSGNIFAIANIYKSLNIPYLMSSDISELAKADKLVLPGVGAFDETMRLFQNLGIKDWLNETVLIKKTPIIGVCVGMQIMAKSSDEGNLPGFGWVDAEVKRFDESLLKQKPHLPHLGWNSIELAKENPLFDGIDFDKGFYFLHTYYCQCSSESDVLSTTNYGKKFASSFNHENIFGVQFHPEKSHSNGLKIFKNFAKL